MQLDIRDIHHRLGLTIVFVTHDQTEALTMSDRIAIFNHGKIEQFGAPSEIYDRPKTQFVAEFIGEINLLSGKVTSSFNGVSDVILDGGQAIKVVSAAALEPRKQVNVSVRPERIGLGQTGSALNQLKVRMTDIVYHGDHLQVQVDSVNCATRSLPGIFLRCSTCNDDEGSSFRSRCVKGIAAVSDALLEWGRVTVVSAAAQRALASDIRHVGDDELFGDLVRRLNSAKSGFRTLMTKTRNAVVKNQTVIDLVIRDGAIPYTGLHRRAR